LPVIGTTTGKVVPHARTLVVPGKPDGGPDVAALAPGDVLLYDITCVARDECSVVRSFGMRLSPDEPGPATAPGNRLVFVRLPLLFAHELQHDLDHIFPSYLKARAQDGDAEEPAAL